MLRAAVASLPPEHRAVVELHHLEGLALAEIAEVLAVPVGTVKSRLFHARAELRAALERAAVPPQYPATKENRS